MTQLSSFWLVSLTPGVIISRLVCIDEMQNQNQSEKRRPGDGNKSLRWPSLPDEVLLSKTPKWLKSLSFHHRHSPPVSSSATFVLPKLPGSDNHSHRPEEESSDVQTGQVHLPPLCFSSGGSSTGSDDKARSSWLLPTFPAFHRKEVYHRQAAARERRQLSAKLARLPPITTSNSSSTSPPPTAQSSSAPPPRSPRGVEGTSVTLLSSRSGRVGTRGEEEEEEEEQQVKMPGTTDVGHRHVHLWSVGGGRRRREEEEDDDERREKAELMALLRPVVSISGHHAPPPVDESYQPTRTTAGSSRDPPTAAAAAGPSTLVNTTTADDFQWTIEWTPSADVFRHHSASSPSSSRSSASDADELIGDEEMAAPWPVERHWRSGSAASRVRHSPPMARSPTPPSRNETKAERPLPAYSTSPPVPALRAKTAHPSMSAAHQLTASQHHQQHYHHQEQARPDRQDSEEIIEEIEHVFDEIDIQSFDDESPADVHHSRLKEDPDDRLELDDDTSVFGGVQLEQLKKLLHQNSGGNNNEVAEEEVDCEGKETTSSSPTFRQDPSLAQQLLTVQPDCLPNAVQQHQYLYHPDDRPISRSPRVVHSPVLGQSESSLRRAFVFEDEEEEVPEEFDDPAEASARLAAPPIQAKSRSVASFASRNTPSPDENGRRQRSLPTRITEKSVPPVKRIGVMPSSVVNRQIKAGQSLSPAAHKTNRPESPQDPKSILQTALKNLHSSEWEIKIEGIRRLEDLITANSDCVAAELHVVVLALLEEIKNLRSQVSRAAIHSMGKMFQHCGKQMEQDLDRTVPLLLSKAGDTNRFIRDDAHAALANVTEFISPPKAIVVIVGESLTHKNATVRAEGAKLLAAIVVKLGPAKTLSGAKDVTERILPAAAHFIQDGSLEARAQAKKIFSVVIEDPIFDKAMQKYLSPSTIRNIQRTLDTLRKTKVY